MSPTGNLTRRSVLVTGAAAASAAPAWAQIAGRRLVFEVWRNNHQIGRHTLVFQVDKTDFSVIIDASMAVGLGPITLFRYHLQGTEIWRGGQFAELRSRAITNGRHEQVTAIRTAEGVVVKTLSASRVLGRTALPLTHWNSRVLMGPMFNPQTGAPMREAVARQDDQVLRLADGRSVTATRYALTGDAQITDWYDVGGDWVALRARASDGSTIEYRAAA